MSDIKKNSTCQIGCWAMAAVAGLLTFVMLLTVGEYTFMPAAFLGALVFVLLGLVFSWLFCTPLPAAGAKSADSGSQSSTTSGSTGSNAGASAAVAAGTSAAVARTSASGSANTAAADKAAADKVAADKAAAEKAASEQAAAEKTAAADKAAADAAAGEDFDGDGVREGADEGTKPATLTAAREGGADDLKRIKGIGPKLEKLCNSMGFYHFDQIAAWTADELAWVNSNLEGFKGRATRDKWVAQAKLLAVGEDTEFSKRVDKGSVY
ncbi:hypothetical protein [Planktotalea sp.]|uniref:hypothetical protein n=1 Tax=Planktotalea sp. TaxID=2029877 RepID=UPI0035C812EA